MKSLLSSLIYFCNKNNKNWGVCFWLHWLHSTKTYEHHQKKVTKFPFLVFMKRVCPQNPSYLNPVLFSISHQPFWWCTLCILNTECKPYFIVGMKMRILPISPMELQHDGFWTCVITLQYIAPVDWTVMYTLGSLRIYSQMSGREW